MDKKSKFLGICILIASLLITSSLGFLIVENRYKVVDNKLFDTFKGQFIETVSTNTKEIISDTSDISKVSILKTTDSINNVFYNVNCTVKNNNVGSISVHVRATFYDKSNSVIFTEDSQKTLLNSGDVKIIQVLTRKNNDISKYDVEIIKDLS